MPYQLVPSSLPYGNDSFLAHNLKGATPEDDRQFFGQRIQSFGIIDFGAMNAGSTKSYTPINDGIQSPISIASVYAFTTVATNDEITFSIFEGTVELTRQKITNNDMPYQFPPGAIIRPDLTIQVKPRYNTMKLLVYWRPVHILHLAQL
jgi:hypothetical protein